MDSKIKSYVIFFGWIAYVLFLMIYWNTLIQTAQTSNILIGSLIYYFTNPAYLLLVYGVVRYATVTMFKKVVASILLVIAMDIVSSPRILLNELSTCVSMTMDTGTIFIKWFSSFGFTPQLGGYVYYLILPVLFFWLSMELLGYTQFIRKLKNGGS